MKNQTSSSKQEKKFVEKLNREKTKNDAVLCPHLSSNGDVEGEASAVNTTVFRCSNDCTTIATMITLREEENNRRGHNKKNRSRHKRKSGGEQEDDSLMSTSSRRFPMYCCSWYLDQMKNSPEICWMYIFYAFLCIPLLIIIVVAVVVIRRHILGEGGSNDP